MFLTHYIGTSADYVGTPSEQVGYKATDEYTSRITSPRPPSTAPKHDPTSPLKSGYVELDAGANPASDDNGDGVIHVDEPERRKGFAKYGNEKSAEDEDEEEEHTHPILAPDEVAKDPSPYHLQPAVEPSAERHGRSRETGESRSRPSSRPTSVYSPPPMDMHSTPLEDVEEYEPLFPEDEKSGKKSTTQAEKLKEYRQRFPSQDIWEDAPNSVHSTAEVSTPELLEARQRERAGASEVPPREGETPAQAFARRQEQLAETEAVTPDSFLYRQQKPPSWVGKQPHLAKETRPNVAQRFPSRDVWEDAPDSLQYTTTVSTPEISGEQQLDEVPKPKPPIPTRPKKQGSGDDSTTSKPSIPDRPKPQIPPRPSKTPEPSAKQKPAVPARPAASKIGAVQAGFLSDLNNRLKIGPQAPKKEESATQEPADEKEKAPLSDARKGRARGPQRRAPTKAASPGDAASGPPPASNNKPVLSFSMTRTLWSIDEEGTMTVDGLGPEVKAPPHVEVNSIPEPASEPETDNAKSEEPKEAQPQAPSEPDTLETKPEEKHADQSPAKPEVELENSKPTDLANEPNPTEETKTLATNTAGESILEETVEKKLSGDDEVQGVEETKDEVIN